MTNFDHPEIGRAFVLEELLLICDAQPIPLRMLGHTAFLEGDMPTLDAVQQACFELCLEGTTGKSIDYARAYTFLDTLFGNEVTIDK